MTIVPKSSPVPLAAPLAMSAAPNLTESEQPTGSSTRSSETSNDDTGSALPQPQTKILSENTVCVYPGRSLDSHVSWPRPRLNLKVQDVSHPAAKLFFQALNATEIFEHAVDAVLTQLYDSPVTNLGSAGERPSVKSVTLVLRSMEGVAYTTGNSELNDQDHKEIHFSLEHIKNTMDQARYHARRHNMDMRRKALSKRRLREQQQHQQHDQAPTSTAVVTPADNSDQFASPTTAASAEGGEEEELVEVDEEQTIRKRAAAEIRGVLVHEMVHCWQWTALGTSPGGLIEGIADYVRLKEGLDPPHWNRAHKGNSWDEGYQTTAFFLEWCEKQAQKAQQAQQAQQVHNGSVGLTSSSISANAQKFTGAPHGTVRQLNALMRTAHWDGVSLWKSVFGRDVNEMWKEYSAEN